MLGEKEDSDHALNEFFKINGFESMSLVRNLGSTFIYLCLYLFALLALVILVVIKYFSSTFTW